MSSWITWYRNSSTDLFIECDLSDEVHQHFIAGRGTQVMCVLIDSSGEFAGVCLF
ncbi:VanZ family protein [Psychrobacillus sp. NPDC096623]|uniref:VanZ family protein n=1 Tax=Psychrobacillus sp. NPDC096623 TaxID=3364492 RepID=UPI00380215A9